MGDDHAELLIAKNRSGEMGIIPLRFNGDFIRFTEDDMSLAEYAAIKPLPSDGYSPFDLEES